MCCILAYAAKETDVERFVKHALSQKRIMTFYTKASFSDALICNQRRCRKLEVSTKDGVISINNYHLNRNILIKLNDRRISFLVACSTINDDIEWHCFIITIINH